MSEEQKKIDWPSFYTCVALIVALYRFLMDEFGVVYLLASLACIGLLLWLALGRYGKVPLSSHGEGPEFSTVSWIAMLFCGGIGAGSRCTSS